MSRLTPIWACTVMLAGCSRLVGGMALPPAVPPVPDGAVDAGRIMLGTLRMRAIMGTDERLTIIPTMDTTGPVDVDELAAAVPPACRFIYAETAVFGSTTLRFHKITYQYPPRPAMVSQGAAVYPDADSARHAFDGLTAAVAECSESPGGPGLVGDWSADEQFLRTQAGACGRAYQVKSVVLLEVTYCGFSDSDAELVLTNMAAEVPG